MLLEGNSLSSKKNKSWYVTLILVSSSVNFKDTDTFQMVFSFSPFYISVSTPDLHMHCMT